MTTDLVDRTRAVQQTARTAYAAGQRRDVFGMPYTDPRPESRTSQSVTMPSWLVERLDRAGWIDAATGAGRQARAARCPACRAQVMRGLTAVPMAVSVDCDPQPLTTTAEVLCLLVGRPTYELRFLGGRYDLDTRDKWRRRERPAGLTKQVDVLAQHRCSDPPPGPHAPTLLIEPVHNPTPDEVPY